MRPNKGLQFRLRLGFETRARLNLEWRATRAVSRPRRSRPSAKEWIFWSILAGVAAAGIWDEISQHLIPAIIALILGGT